MTYQTNPRVSIVIPAYNEGDAIVAVPRPDPRSVAIAVRGPGGVRRRQETPRSHDLARITRERAAMSVPTLNTYGRGPANAIRYGFDHVSAPVVVVTMADGSDDPQQIDDLPAGRARSGRRGRARAT